MLEERLLQLIDYAVSHGLIEEEDRVWALNALLDALGLSGCTLPGAAPAPLPLEDILRGILDEAVARGFIDGGIASRDLLDARLMAVLTPRPSAVIAQFRALYAQSPEAATDWYYSFSRATDYIRTYRVAKDIRWVTQTEYGPLDITINLSKPEKDPRAIAAAKQQKSVGYPKCLLCREAEGYLGRLDYPGRGNHRLIPLTLDGQPWFLQYSPYVYYNEHCIVLNRNHIPMKIDEAAFRRLLDFVTLFPHYFVGSNADLPIVGGSILSHDHFQGGRYCFAMERAPVERPLTFRGYADVQAGVVRWPLSVIRLRCPDRARLAALAGRILAAWRVYSDPSVSIYAETDGEMHNTITPIARRRGADYELDLVLRNNLCTPEHPFGLFHPHEELHHIKKENIGLIEVMGLAILPARLKDELHELKDALLTGADIRAIDSIAKHADWADALRARHTFTAENADAILRDEVGAVFKTVLEHAGVFKRDAQGMAALLRFAESVS